jgi:hypothetical protein
MQFSIAIMENREVHKKLKIELQYDPPVPVFGNAQRKINH